MENMILVDIETGGFDLAEGIREVALLVIEKNSIVNELHLAEIEDSSLIHLGMGEGYADISEDITKIECFKDIVERYKYPIVAHNISFDRKIFSSLRLVR